MQRPAAQFCQEQPRDSVRAMMPVTLEVTIRPFTIELFLRLAILIAARHIDQLTNRRVLIVAANPTR